MKKLNTSLFKELYMTEGDQIINTRMQLKLNLQPPLLSSDK